ncbi:hypothetical protein QSV08_18625 [Maribacter sp. BPC-D8]|uniref:hypothetical protein n=1 Tax=Maribacter sp. BPC-D8 TaxID=3053613 RepID=UPI002B487523|nr:hypothetical protein [Maribacter sp. BPC-D8]WRI29224.1 hypothetical protein QSV08_18625 [Maribacter sp. BPC-D8]
MLDQIQLDFFKTYKKIESEELILQPIEGENSKWSSNAMFDLTPLHIERSRGNLTFTDISEEKPKTGIITEALYHKNKLATLKNWNGNELTGMSVFSYDQSNKIKIINVSIDEDDQELRGLTIFSIQNNKIVDKTQASIYGAFTEHYIYSNDQLIEIRISKRIDYINETIDTIDGISNVPENNFSYLIEYKNDKLFQIIGENGSNILKIK